MDSKGNPMLNGARLEDLASRLKEAIINSSRVYGYCNKIREKASIWLSLSIHHMRNARKWQNASIRVS